MSADQASGSGALILLLLLGLMGMFAGIGIMLSGLFGPNAKSDDRGLGPRVWRIIVVFGGGIMVFFWLAAPGTGQGIAAFINALWANLVIALQPLIAIVTQLAMIAAVLVAGYYGIKHFYRRR